MTPRLRALAGPAVVGLAVWCASGHLAVATAASAASRLVVAAPWWHFALGLLGAALVPALRRDPRLGLPALVSTIPWWPVPLPPLALIWTGPLAWAPIALAVGAALVSRELAAGPPPASSSTSCGTPHSAPRSAVWLAAGLTTAMTAAAAWSASPRVPGGDEPHYLAIAQSLVRDGDLRIENNHHDPDFVAAFGDTTPDYVMRGRDGQIYSIHAPGVAALVAPAFALAGYRGAQATVIAVTAWAAALVWAIAWRTTRNTGAAWFAWAAIAGSTTFLLQGFMVFPDAPGAFAVAAGVWLIVRLAAADDRVPPGALTAASVALAALPWLHTRFSVLAAGLGAVIVWQIFADQTRPKADRLRRLAAFAVVPVISAIGWFGYFQVIYGTPNPTVPYGDSSGPNGQNVAYAPGGLTALLFDEQFGLLVYAPVLVVALLGLFRLTKDRVGRNSLAVAGVAALYLSIAATYWMWWAGVPATPARLVTATLPALAVPLARSWRERVDWRAAFVMMLGVTLALSLVVIGVDRGALAWNVRGSQARWLQWVGPVANLRRGWPSFFWRLDPGNVVSEMPFFLHVFSWLVLWALGWVLLVQPRRPQSVPLAVAWYLVIMVSLGVALGWMLTRASPLDPARAQFAVLAEIARGRQAIRLDAWSVQWVRSPGGIMQVMPEEPDPEATRAFAMWDNVPPGTYQVRLGLTRPRAGQVRVRFGADAISPEAIDLQPMSEQSFTIAVPHGADHLSIELDDGLQGVVRKLELAPLAIGR
jgi:hypothetical protein